MTFPRSLLLLGLSGTALTLACAPQSSEVEPEPTSGTGTLVLVANGEDFVRKGFVSKDGWRIDFDRVVVNLANVDAFQTEPAFAPSGDAPLQATQTVTLIGEPQSVDLAAGDAAAAPIVVVEQEAPAGVYNALGWQLVADPAGNTIVLAGTAKKETREIAFVLAVDTELAYTCGEFIGEERKGFLNAGESAELEVTFHFDHLFGDGEAPTEDEINVNALGFSPLAALATEDILHIEQADLKTSMDPTDYDVLESAIVGIGHVGEGHCRQENVDS